MSYTFRAHGMEMEASYDTEDTPASRHHHHAFARAKDTSAEIDTSHEDSIHVAHPRDALFDGEEDEDLGRRMFNNKDYEDYSDEEDVDFLKAIYERTVDGACRSVNLQGPCMISIDDQLDLFTVSLRYKEIAWRTFSHTITTALSTTPLVSLLFSRTPSPRQFWRRSRPRWRLCRAHLLRVLWCRSHHGVWPAVQSSRLVLSKVAATLLQTRSNPVGAQ